MKKSHGFTMVEMMVTAALMSLTILGMIRVTQGLNRLGSTNMEKQLIENDANIVLTRLIKKIKEAGDGLQGNILAVPDNPLANASPDIIFLSKDNVPMGTLGAEDYWTRYYVGTRNGASGVYENIYQSADWASIKLGIATLVQSNFIQMQKGVVVTSLDFTFYDGQYPPKIANQSPEATSAVRVAAHFKTTHSKVVREQTVNLENLIYGAH